MPYKNPEDRKARVRWRYAQNSMLREQMYEWRRKNPEKWVEICRRSYQKRLSDPLKKQKIYAQQRAASTRWWKNHRDKLNEKHRRQGQRLKHLVMTHYSQGIPQCNRCKFGDVRALSIDHINGAGRLHKKHIKKTGNAFYQWLKNQGYPDGYQVLCMNCQWIKRFEKGEFVGGTNYLYHKEAGP